MLKLKARGIATITLSFPSGEPKSNSISLDAHLQPTRFKGRKQQTPSISVRAVHTIADEQRKFLMDGTDAIVLDTVCESS